MGEDITTEALYYRAFNSFLLQKQDFRFNFEMLRDQYHFYPESFKILRKCDVLRLQKMQESYKTGRYCLFDGGSLDASPALPRLDKYEKGHQDLCMNIYKHKETTLEPFTGPIDSSCFEYPVIYGSIDIMVRSASCAYIIEVKTEEIDHAIIGQVMKYYIGMCLQLNLKFFEDIKIITICPGYETSAFNGLKQINATPLLIDTKSFRVW